MLKKIEDLNYYELLEVDPRATSQEIHKAYERTRRIYDPNSIALYSLFSQEETENIHQRIEEAYRTLTYEENRRKYDASLREQRGLPEAEPVIQQYRSWPAQQQPVRHMPRQEGPRISPPERAPQVIAPAPFMPDTLQPVPPSISEFSGPALKALREQRNLSIRNVADITKVGSRYLEQIEAENFQKLPARPYLRGFLTLYAKALGYEPGRIVNDYLKRYEAEMSKPRA